MSQLIRSRKDADKLGAAMRVLGWTPSVGIVSYDAEVRGYSIGTVVKIGDERLKWEAHERNPMIDFFSIANIANGASKALAKKPVGFEWAVAGVDAVQLTPSRNETVTNFIERLRALTPPQRSFNFDMDEADQSATIPDRVATQTHARPRAALRP